MNTQWTFTPSGTATVDVPNTPTVVTLPTVDPSNTALVVTNNSAGIAFVAIGLPAPTARLVTGMPGDAIAPGDTRLFLTSAGAATSCGVNAPAGGSMTFTRGTVAEQTIFSQAAA